VIIVDYRGFDTLGEITVLGIAGADAARLLAGWAPPSAPAWPPAPGEAHPLMLQLAAPGAALSWC
jgi:hypothetical protein